jgi:hypothetical protein
VSCACVCPAHGRHEDLVACDAFHESRESSVTCPDEGGESGVSKCAELDMLVQSLSSCGLCQ